LGTLALRFGTGIAPETIAIKLYSLTGLLSKIVDNYGFRSHLNNVGRMRAVKLGTQQFREIVLLIYSFLEGWTISSPLVGCRALMAYYG
jgi:hypothetical protein